jgi:hypothetical protein
MAARAHRVTDRAEAEKVLRMLPLKYPDAPPQTANMNLGAGSRATPGRERRRRDLRPERQFD